MRRGFKSHITLAYLVPGVMKSVMGELTDSSNRAEGFALMPVVWGAGATMGCVVLSLIGFDFCYTVF